jgi:hypothetical protein
MGRLFAEALEDRPSGSPDRGRQEGAEAEIGASRGGENESPCPLGRGGCQLAWSFVVGTASFGFFACVVALMAAVCGSQGRGQAWQKRMASLAKEGAPDAERRALLAEARKGAKTAAAAAESEGAEAPGVGGKKRKTSRL